MKNIVLLICLICFTVHGWSQDWKFRSDSLVKRQQYLSAYELLDTISDEEIEVTISKVNLALDYYYSSQYHREFGFINLRKGEELEELRQNNIENACKFNLPIDTILIQLQKENPKDYRITYLLGKYYYTVFLLFGERWGSASEWLLDRSNQLCLDAYVNGVYDYYSLYILGYYNTLMENYHEARHWFNRSLQLKNEPLTNYNLAVCCLFDGMFYEGVGPAKESYYGFVDSLKKSDASRVTGILYAKTDEKDSALIYFQEADKLSPNFKPNQLYLLKTYIDLGQVDEVNKLGVDVLTKNAKDPDLAQEFLDMFEQTNNNLLLQNIFDDVLLQVSDDEAMGNILFHYAKLEYSLGKPNKCKRRLKQAQKHFEIVFDEGHQVFQSIEMMLNHI